MQKAIEDFDGRVLNIKNWSVVFGFSSVAAAFASHTSAVLLCSAVSAACFWYLEVLWKLSQSAFYARNRLLEQYFRGEAEAPKPLQIATEWYTEWTKLWRESMWKRLALWPHVALPHCFVLVASVFLFCFFGRIEKAAKRTEKSSGTVTVRVVR